MRAWAVAEALGRRYSVSLVVPRPDGLPVPGVLPDNVSAAGPTSYGPAERARVRAAILYRSRRGEPEDWPCGARLPRHIEAAKFDAVHLFRHSMAPYAASFLGRVPCRLDLDESEVRTRLRIARLCEENGLAGRARRLQSEARFLEREERTWLPGFDTVYVSSDAERQYLTDRQLTSAAVLLPNTVPVPPAPPAPSAGGEPTLLFVGNMNYYPNEDALCFFASDVLPLLAEAGRTFRVQVAGYGPPALRRTINARAGIEWPGFVDDLASLYRGAHLVIAPIRAGGGTRIKILGAFANRRAIISTPAGAEGLEVVDGIHLLLGETAPELAAACIRLIEHPELRDEIARAGYDLALRRYSPSRLEAILV